MSEVGLLTANYKSIYKKIAKSVELGGNLNISDDDTVAIKINLCDFRLPETGAVTHPLFLDAFLKYLRSRYNDLTINVIESDATVARPNMLIKWLGFTKIFQDNYVNFINLSRDKHVIKRINGRYFKTIKVPETINNSDYFISMSKLKTCLLTTITCTLKNQFGCLPDPYKVKYHKKLDDVIVDCNLAMKPDFSIVDGIIAMGGVKGPDLGVPLKTNIVVSGKDPVATDSACASIMGFNVNSIKHIKKSKSSGLGSIKFKFNTEEKMILKYDFEKNLFYSWILKRAMSMK